MIQQQNNTDTPGFWRGLASLTWLDTVISFLFRLVAKLAEPFLAFGLIASAIDYGSRGQFMAGHSGLMTIWISTQAIALEGSGGIALSMSFDAAREGDQRKAWMQRVLALLLLLTGGIMFFVELVSNAAGFNESAMPQLYIFSMAALRTFVSLGYIAMMRTAHHRFSGDTAQQNATPTIAQPVDLTAHIKAEVETLAQSLKAELRNEIQGLNTTIVQVVQQSQPTAQVTQGNREVTQTSFAQSAMLTEAEADPAQSFAQMIEGTAHSLHPERTTAQHTEPLRTVQAVQGEDKRAKIHAYIAQYQQEHGVTAMPTVQRIMTRCTVAKNTATKYRSEYKGVTQ